MSLSSVCLKVNCGFARVAIRQYSEVVKRKHFVAINCYSTERARKFKELFTPLEPPGIQTSLFDGYDHRECPFERHCKGINGLFAKWKNREKNT